MAADSIRLRQQETCLQPGGKHDEELHPGLASSPVVLRVDYDGKCAPTARMYLD